MPWECKFIAEEEANKPDYKPEYGHLRHAPPWHGYLPLSPEYKRDWEAKRPPILVYIPMMYGDGETVTGRWFCPDKCCGNPNGQGVKPYGWTVTGEVPNITVHPSINAIGSYHGWLQNGVLSDDIEGRTYPAEREESNMFIDAAVKQIDILPQDKWGIVVECTAAEQCRIAAIDSGNKPGPGQPKNCLLSVPNHGSRCCAWPEDTTKWLIDADPNKVKALP